MTELSAEQLKVANLTDDYIRDLEPENQRYDITLASDFVISVLPNGIKTWAFIYDFQGRHRRKTLGVFPDMNFNDAKIALERSRGAMIRMDEPTEPPEEFSRRPAVLSGSHYVPKTRRRPSYKKLLKPLGLLAVLGLLGAAAMWWKNRPPAPIEVAPTTPVNAPFKITKQPTTAPAPSGDSSTSKSSNASRDTGAQTSDLALEKPATVSATSNPNATPDVTTNTSNAASSDTASNTMSATVDRTDVVSSNATGTTSSAPTSTSPSTDSQPSIAEPSTSSDPAISETSTNSSSTTTSPASSSNQSSSSGTGATAYGGSVARSTLSSNVVQLEPTDQLGPEISYNNSGFTRIFYFTELREFSDGIVIHRWERDGQIVDEVELRVKRSWRWRTYSSKDLTPGLDGEWRVSTIDATGAVLNAETFTYGAR